MPAPKSKPKTVKAPPASATRKPNSVEAIKVAIRMLNEMALARRAMRITDLANKMGETKPHIHRLLATLKEMGLVENFIEIICAGFASNRTEIKIATIYGLTQIITKKDLGLERSFLDEVFELVLILLK